MDVSPRAGSVGSAAARTVQPANGIVAASNPDVPFTNDDFFDVLAAYNTSMWPAALALWLLSVVVVGYTLRASEPPHVVISLLLAVHWAWSAIGYHALFFTRVNPAAWLFAAVFLIEAGIFLWAGVARQRLQFSIGRSPRYIVAAALILYGLAYPAVTLAEGMAFPRVPTFGLPCPTTIFTAGLLMTLERPTWSVAIVPVVWAVIGGSAAVLFGVTADLMLPVAAVLLAGGWIRRPAHA